MTSPNNPDGELKEAILEGPSVKTIYDRVYYWPLYTPIPAPASEDLMLFSISKLTGHAGSRFGYNYLTLLNIIRLLKLLSFRYIFVYYYMLSDIIRKYLTYLLG